MTPGIDAKMEDMKPKRTTGIGVCTHLFIFIAGLLVSPKHECYLLIQTLADWCKPAPLPGGRVPFG